MNFESVELIEPRIRSPVQYLQVQHIIGKFYGTPNNLSVLVHQILKLIVK